VSKPTASTPLSGAEVLRDPLIRELLDARLVCVLATLDSQHAIHAVPMWFAVEEDAIVLATGDRSRKVQNIERDARATFVAHDSRPGFEVCGAAITGRIAVVRGEAAAVLVEQVHRRYVAPEAEADDAVRAFMSSDDVALRLRPESAWTWDERRSEANEALRSLGAALPLLSTEPRD
jgi:nitroimidazol reductase NimA-like FMN-containing flavoprotein (pyridoxamine 5'-phosphate oxidase superfamily)